MRRFLPLAGACRWRGFWAWACACDSRDARVRASAQGGRSASQAKALRRRQGRAFFPPFLWRSKERGRGGSGGAQPPRSGVGLPCVSCYDPNKNHLHGTALLDCDTALITATRHAASLQTPKIPYQGIRQWAGTRYARHRPYQERDSQSHQLIAL